MLQVFAAYLEDALVGILRVHPDGHCHGCTLCFGSAAASARPLTWRYFRLRFHAYQAAAIVVTYARSSARKQGPGALLTAAGCVFVSPSASTRHILGGQHGPGRRLQICRHWMAAAACTTYAGAVMGSIAQTDRRG